MRWLAHVAVRANPKRNGVMIRSRRHNFASLPLALSSASENPHWNLSATMLSCPWSIWDSFRGIQSHTHNWSFGWITIKSHNKIKYLKVPTYAYALPVVSSIVLAHTVFDVVVDNEVEILVGEAVVLCENVIYCIDQWLGKFWNYALDSQCVVGKPHSSLDSVC